MIPAIYETTIAHTRIEPLRRTFRYRSHSWLIDVDDLPRPPWWARMLVGFRAGDHLQPPPSGPDTLRTRVDHALAGAGVPPRPGTVTALLNARCLGYVFDPLTLFWCRGPDGTTYAAIAEVHNTYGGQHAYVLTPDEHGRAEVHKSFFVSPFNSVDGRYRMRIAEPDRRLHISVILDGPHGPRLVATMHGVRRAITANNILRAQLRTPLVPLMVKARITFQGIRLWLAGLPITRPAAADAAGCCHGCPEGPKDRRTEGPI